MHWFEERWKKCNELRPDDINNYRLRRKDKPPQKEFKALTEGSSAITFSGNELKPVEGRKNMLEAFDVMRDRLSYRAEEFKNFKISTPGSNKELDVYWHKHKGVWCSFSYSDEKNKFWNCFGIENPAHHKTLIPTVEINPPIQKEIGVGGNNGGVFLNDRQGNTYVGHTGSISIASTNYKDKSKSHFLAEYEKLCGRESIVAICLPGKPKRKVILLGRVDEPDLIQKVSKFVKRVAEFKSGLPI